MRTLPDASSSQTQPAFRRRPFVAMWLVLAVPLCGASARAQDSPVQQDAAAGQEDLDNATLAKLSADSLTDLETVVELCDSALEKGLDESNQEFARSLLKSTLFEQASGLSRLIFDQQPPDARWRQIRQVSLSKLQRALEIDASMGNVHLLIARLQTLPGGDAEAAQEAIAKAIPELADEPELLSGAYQVRAGLTDEREESLADLNKAIELYPRNLAAWRARGVFHMAGGDFDKALSDLQELLTRDPDDLLAHQAIAQTLRELKQFDEAVEHLDQVIEANPDSSLAFNLKARIEEEKGNIDAALDNLNQAIQVQPNDLGAILYRARLLTASQQFDLALADVDQALKLRPQLPQAVLLRSMISAAQDRYDDAIADLRQLLNQEPDNTELKIQIGVMYEADRQPRKAIELYNEILEKDPDNWTALRRRGDAQLSIANQGEAIRDYEAALVLNPDDTGSLNNLAWVLATSPNDALRNGQRALEHARKACELTQYEAPHILSTLAASYAELGQFEEAIKWSAKAVAMDADEAQLANELESYQAGKPWRESQQVEQTAPPTPSSDADQSAPVFDDLPDLDARIEAQSGGAQDTAAPATPEPSN